MDKPTRIRFKVLGALCIAAALAYLMRNAIGPAESTIRSDLGLTREQSGLLISAFFWPYALCQIPAAALTQRIGFVKSLSLFAAVWSLACAGFAFGDYRTMVGARALMGVAQAGIVPGAIGMLAGWFPRATQGASSGAFSAAMSIGNIVTAPLTAWLSAGAGWRAMFVWYAIPGLLWAAWFVRRGSNSPSDDATVNAGEVRLIQHGQSEVQASKSAAWSGLLLSGPVLLLCLQQICRAAGYIFFASWFTTYLQEARGLTLVHSGALTMLPFVGDVGGSFFGGVISDAVLHRTGNPRIARQWVSAVAMAACALLVWLAARVEGSLPAVCIISIGMFCAGVGNPCANAVAMRLGGAHVAAVSGLNNMCGNLGAAAFPMVVPLLLKTAAGWDLVLSLFAGLYVVAALSWFLMKDPECPAESL